MDPVTTIKMVHEYGLIAVLVLVMTGIAFTWRYAMRILLDEENGIIVKGHAELIQSIQMNRESNRLNAESNMINAAANERHARSHERTSRVLEALANRVKAQDIIDAGGTDD